MDALRDNAAFAALTNNLSLRRDWLQVESCPTFAEVLDPHAKLLAMALAAPMLDEKADEGRCRAILAGVRGLSDDLGESLPSSVLMRSLYLVSLGTGVADAETLRQLEACERVLRTVWADAPDLLALNLAAQGFHKRGLGAKEEAVASLMEAFDLMMTEEVCTYADAVKVAWLLADCLEACGRIRDALGPNDYAEHLLEHAESESPAIVAEYDAWMAGFFSRWFVPTDGLGTIRMNEELVEATEAARGIAGTIWPPERMRYVESLYY